MTERLDPSDPSAVRRFIAGNTRCLAPPLVPEIKLHLAEESLAIWSKTEEDLGMLNLPPPYWAFAWAGGQALARYVLDNPELVAGRLTVDLGTGSGLTAIAAKLAGATSVLAADIDRIALIAALMNAELNGVTFETTTDDQLAAPQTDTTLLLIGDLFYERALAERVIDYIETAAARGAMVLIGDPQRNYFPRGRYAEVARYKVPVTRDLEDAEIKNAAVWRVG